MRCCKAPKTWLDIIGGGWGVWFLSPLGDLSVSIAMVYDHSILSGDKRNLMSMKELIFPRISVHLYSCDEALPLNQ